MFDLPLHIAPDGSSMLEVEEFRNSTILYCIRLVVFSAHLACLCARAQMTSITYAGNVRCVGKMFSTTIYTMVYEQVQNNAKCAPINAIIIDVVISGSYTNSAAAKRSRGMIRSAYFE